MQNFGFCQFQTRDAQPRACGPDLAPEVVISDSHSRFKNTRNFSWM